MIVKKANRSLNNKRVAADVRLLPSRFLVPYQSQCLPAAPSISEYIFHARAHVKMPSGPW